MTQPSMSHGPVRRARSALLVAALLAGAPAAAREQPFLDGVAAGVVASARSVAEADFDLDGDPDLAATSLGGDEVVWVENAAGVWSVHSVTATYDGPDDLVAADMDCDGDPDLVFGVANEDKLVWAENDGQGASWSLGDLISSAASGINALAVGRLTVDASPDVVASLPDNAEIVTYWRPGGCASAAWSSAVAASGLDTVNDLELADVTGDGRLDLVAAEYDAVASVVSTWENPGSAGAWPQTVIDAAFPDNALAVAAGDVDGDGDLDAAACALDGDLAWWANPAGAGAWAETPIGTLLGCRALELGDVDRDGDLDAAATSGAALTSWWENEAADGTAWSERPLSPADDPNDVVLADLDRDGDHDLVAADLGLGQLTLHQNASTGRSAAPDLLLWFFYDFLPGDLIDLESADLDGDGLLDVVGIWEGSQPSDTVVDWFAGLGASDTFGVLQFDFTVGEIHRGILDFLESLALGDVDGDGDPDAVVGPQTSIGGNSYFFCRNDGGATAWTCLDVSSGANGDWRVDALELADVDADGDLDILAAVEETLNGVHSVLWLENSGDPEDPADWLRHVVAAAGPYDDLVVVDLDGDADLDVLASGGDWWRNDGGSPPVWVAQTVDPELSGSPAVGDVDGDGDLDVVGVTFDPIPGFGISWFENALPGAWTAHEVYPPAVDLPGASVALADLDVDGDLDLAAHMIDPAAPAEHRLSWFENAVAAGDDPWVERAIDPTGTAVSHLLPGDFDRDGDPDLVIADLFGNGEFQSWSNGGGQFGLPTSAVSPPTIAEGVERAVLAVEAFHRGRPAEEAMELSALSLLFEEETGGNPEPLTQEEFDDLVEAVRLYRDDGSGSFVPELDELVGDFDALALTEGRALLELADGEPALQHAPEETPATYFLALELTATAAAAGVSTVTVTHTPGVPCAVLDEAPQQASAAENAAFDTPLLQEVSAPVAATFDVLESEIFDDGFESGDTSAWDQTID